MSDDAIQESTAATMDVGQPPADRAPVGQALEAPPAAGLEVWILEASDKDGSWIAGVYTTRAAAMRRVAEFMSQDVTRRVFPVTVRE